MGVCKHTDTRDESTVISRLERNRVHRRRDRKLKPGRALTDPTQQLLYTQSSSSQVLTQRFGSDSHPVVSKLKSPVFIAHDPSGFGLVLGVWMWCGVLGSGESVANSRLARISSARRSPGEDADQVGWKATRNLLPEEAAEVGVCELPSVSLVREAVNPKAKSLFR